jgi:hypothetical protein
VSERNLNLVFILIFLALITGYMLGAVMGW